MTTSPAAPSDHGLRTTFPATLLIALAALAAVAPLATDAYLPAFAQMADDLGVSASSVQLTMTTFLVGIALGQLGIGVLSDRVGRRPLLLWGSVLALVASIGAALAPSLFVLLVARFCDRLAVLAGGTVLAEGPPAEVLQPDTLAQVYGLRVRIVPDGDHVMVAPETEQEA